MKASMETKGKRGRPPGTKNPPGSAAGGKRADAGRKPKPPAEKLIKLTIAISAAELIEMAQVLSLTQKTQRQALMAGIQALKQTPEYLAALADDSYPPF
jgi:hypothetical protein